MSRIGVLGGTFDPIHLGHVAVAEAALGCARLDIVLLVPAAAPPHKPAPAASATDRLAMARLAIEGKSKLEASEVELRRGGASYTLETLHELRRLHPDDELFLILGWDAAREIQSWHQPDAVLAAARLVILSRPTLPDPLEADLVQAGIQPDRAIVCSEKTPDIRATDVRRLAAAGASLEGLVAPAVERYIRSHLLYDESAQAGSA